MRPDVTATRLDTPAPSGTAMVRKQMNSPSDCDNGGGVVRAAVVLLLVVVVVELKIAMHCCITAGNDTSGAGSGEMSALAMGSAGMMERTAVSKRRSCFRRPRSS